MTDQRGSTVGQCVTVTFIESVRAFLTNKYFYFFLMLDCLVYFTQYDSTVKYF